MGRNCLQELLRHRPDRLRRVFIAEPREDAATSPKRRESLVQELESHRVPFEWVARQQLDAMVSSDSHQGVVAEVAPRPALSFDELCRMAESQDAICILVLDGVLDPQNFGAILRAAECFRVDAVLWSRNRGAPLGPVVSKASVGASELVPLCPVSNVHQSLEQLKKRGVWTVGAVIAPGASPLEAFEFPSRCAVVMGSEGEGIQPLIERTLDFRVFISMHGALSSLNVSQATTVMLHAVALQRGHKGDVKAS